MQQVHELNGGVFHFENHLIEIRNEQVETRHGNDGYRQTRSRADGLFDLALNGGGRLTVSYTKTDYLPVQRMAVIVAASVPGCKVYPGEFDGRPSDTGDLEHIREQLGDGILLPANQGFVLSPDCVHESIVFAGPTQRQFLRIALPL